LRSSSPKLQNASCFWSFWLSTPEPCSDARVAGRDLGRRDARRRAGQISVVGCAPARRGPCGAAFVIRFHLTADDPPGREVRWHNQGFSRPAQRRARTPHPTFAKVRTTRVRSRDVPVHSTSAVTVRRRADGIRSSQRHRHRC
jgi:hypothetical protein